MRPAGGSHARSFPRGEPSNRVERIPMRETSGSWRGDSSPADAVLLGEGASCSLLTPLIRQRMRDLESGQVLDVVSDEPTAPVDIASWCRLTGNTLLGSRGH